MPSTSSSASAKPSGSTTDTYASPASAPIAAMSESAVASAFQPMSRAPCVPRSKCTPSTSVSMEVTAKARARVTAASSPVQRTSLPLRSLIAASIAAIRSSSPTGLDQPGAAVPSPPFPFPFPFPLPLPGEGASGWGSGGVSVCGASSGASS